MFAEYSSEPELMTMSALQWLHGFDMTVDPPNRNNLRHGPPGEYDRTIEQVAEEYARWQARCQEFDRDPDGFRIRVRERAEAAAAAEPCKRG